VAFFTRQLLPFSVRFKICKVTGPAGPFLAGPFDLYLRLNQMLPSKSRRGDLFIQLYSNFWCSVFQSVGDIPEGEIIIFTGNVNGLLVARMMDILQCMEDLVLVTASFFLFYKPSGFVTIILLNEEY